MSKQTMVMVLSEHDGIAWGAATGKAHCGGCDTVLCDVAEPMVTQDWRLREHQADVMLDAGLGLTRPAEADAWEHGLEAGFDFAANQSTPSGISIDPPLNPYL